MAAEGSSESLTEYCAFVSVQSKVKIFIERIEVPLLTRAESFSEHAVEISEREYNSALSAPIGPTNLSKFQDPRSHRAIRRRKRTHLVPPGIRPQTVPIPRIP